MLEMARLEEILIPLSIANGFKYIRLSDLGSPALGDKIVTMGVVNSNINRNLKSTGGTFTNKNSQVTIAIASYTKENSYDNLSLMSETLLIALESIDYYPIAIKDNTGGNKKYPSITYVFARNQKF